LFGGANTGYPEQDRLENAGRAPSKKGARTMSGVDKAKNKADKLAGKAKEKFGAATDDKDKKHEGKADQTKSDLKDAGEKVKDAFRH
jgi:uncharacterized protein YjbJ (UPF0337 family)